MSNSSRNKYICIKCGETLLCSKKPTFCPFCGGQEMKLDIYKAQKHAKELIDQMNLIIPKLEDTWTSYVNAYVEFENMRRILMSYARRNIIQKNDIPTVEKKKLLDALYDYRKDRKESKL